VKLYIIAGAHGSGKTTFAKSFASIHELYFINADEIATDEMIYDNKKWQEFIKDIS